MKWSKAVVYVSILALCLQTVGCKTDSKSSLKGRKVGGSGGQAQNKIGPNDKNAATSTLNQRPENVDPNQKSSPTSSQLTSEEKCYADLCLADSNHVSYEAILKRAMTPNPEQKAYFQQHIEPLLKRAMDSHAKNLKLTSEAFKAKESEFQKTKLSGFQKNILKALVYFYKNDLLPSDQVKAVAEKARHSPFLKAFDGISVKGAASYFESLYPKLDVQKAARKEAEDITKIVAEFNQALNSNSITLNTSAFTRAKNNMELDTDDLRTLARNSVSIRLLDLLLRKDLAADFDKIQISEEQLKKIYSDANIHDVFAKQLKNMEQAKGICEAYFYGAINLFPRSEEIENFKETAELVKDTTLSLLKKDDPAYKAIQESKVYYPRENNSVVSTWTTELKNEYNSNKEDIDSLKKYDDSTLLTYAIIQALTKTEEYKVCGQLIDLEFDDSALSKEKSVKVSWMSVKNPAYGVSLLGHEYGHIIHSFSNGFEKQKACLSEKQESKTLYVSEDLSDLIAAKVADSLQNSLNKKLPNLGCFLASLGDGKALKNKDSTDPHSAGLYRALQFAAIRKEAIPASCQDLVKQEKPKALEICE